MTQTLVERLRAAHCNETSPCLALLHDEAADELERLHTLAQAAGFTGDDAVGEALRAIPELLADGAMAKQRRIESNIAELKSARFMRSPPHDL